MEGLQVSNGPCPYFGSHLFYGFQKVIGSQQHFGFYSFVCSHY